MDNSNLREDQEKAIRDALMMAAAAHRHAELGQASDAKELIGQLIERLSELASKR